MKMDFPAKQEAKKNKVIVQETTTIENSQEEKLDTIEKKIDLILKGLNTLGGVDNNASEE